MKLKLTCEIAYGGEVVFSGKVPVGQVEAAIAYLSGDVAAPPESVNGNGRSFVSVNPPSRLTEADLVPTPAEQHRHQRAEEKKVRARDLHDAKRAGGRNPHTTGERVVEMIPLIVSGRTDAQVAAAFEVTKECVNQIRTGGSWYWLTGFEPGCHGGGTAKRRGEWSRSMLNRHKDGHINQRGIAVQEANRNRSSAKANRHLVEIVRRQGK